MNINIKKEFLFVPNTAFFSENDKEIIKKAITAMSLQENQYYDEKRNDYSLKWQDIFPLLLTDNEKNSGLGYFMIHFGWNLWNDLNDMFDEIFALPKPPAHLSRSNWAHRETKEYQEFLQVYNQEKQRIIQNVLNEWDEIKKKVIEEIA